MKFEKAREEERNRRAKVEKIAQLSRYKTARRREARKSDGRCKKQTTVDNAGGGKCERGCWTGEGGGEVGGNAQ